jgi:hypothetical protein
MDEIRKEIEKFLDFPPISEQIGAKPHFGRLILKDERSKEHPMRKLAAKPPSVKMRKERSWRPRWKGDQGSSSMCTAFSFLHLFESEPINHPRSYGRFKGAPTPVLDPRILYCEAQQIDPWPGGCGQLMHQDAYDGTSVLAMMKVAQNRGFISEYAWEFNNVDTIVDALLNHGPVIVGTDWFENMSLKVGQHNQQEALLIPTGRLEGGHAYLLDGVNLSKGAKGKEIRILNSWGKMWGWSGHAYMSLETLDFLLRRDGEAVIVKEVP